MSNKIVKAGLGYTIGNYLLKGLVFFTIPIFARLLDPSDYGKYSIFVAYESIFVVISSLAIFTSYKNARYKYGLEEDGAEKGKDYRNYRSTTLAMLCCLLVLWLVVINTFSNFFCNILGLDTYSLNLLVIYSISSAVISCFNIDVGLEYKYESFLKIAGINAVTSIALSIAFILTIFDNQRYMGRVVGTVIPVFVLACYIVWHYFQQAKPSNIKPFLSWGIKYSLPLVPHGLSQIILNQFDRIMINSMIGAFQAGIYSFAYNIFNIVSVTTASLDNVWGPWFYEKMHAEEYAVIREKSKYYMLFLFAFVSCIILISPELINLLGTKNYNDSVYCVIPLIAGGFFAFMYYLPAGVEYFYEKTKFIALGTLSAAIINIVLNYYVINNYDYSSVAYTTLITYMLYFCFHYILAWIIHGKCLYSTEIVLVCSFSVLVIMFLTIEFLDNAWLRWMLMFLFLGIALYFEEKNLGLGYSIVRKLKGRC